MTQNQNKPHKTKTKMAKYNSRSLGYALAFEGPGSVEDYDAKAGRKNACLEDAVDNTIYRGTLPEWGDAFCTKVQELTSIERAVDTEATAKAQSRAKEGTTVKPILEKPKSYNLRVRAAVKAGEVSGVTLADLDALAQQVADGISIDPSPSTRTGGAVAKIYLEKADTWLALDDDALEGKVSIYLTEIPSYNLDRGEDGKPTRDSLGRLINAVMMKRLEQD